MTQTVVAETGHRREWRLVLAVRLLAFLVGVAVAVVVAGLGRYGQGLMLSTAAFGLCVLAGTAIGETVVRPRRDPGPRTASLVARRVRDYLPSTTWVVAAQVVLLAATLTGTTLTGHGRSLTCSDDVVSQAHTPYAGAFYSVPLAVTLVVVLATAALAARQVVDRPRGMAGTDDADDGLRRRSLDVVVAATGVAVGAPLVGIALTTGASLRGLASAQPTCAPGWWATAGVAFLLLALLALVSVGVMLGRLVPASRS